jgi:nucleoid-associated protein YgaU
VIQDISWGTNVIYDFNDSGSLVRYRQDAVIHLLQRVAADIVELSSKAPGNTRGTTAKGARHSTHVVKTGESLPSIAVKEYGDRDKWKVIASANNVRDPRHPKVGTRLKLP